MQARRLGLLRSHHLEKVREFRKHPGRTVTSMYILSLQSAVAHGHVGNSAAVFALQRLGHEAWPIDTVRFSNHPGRGAFRGTTTPPGEIAALMDGLASHNWIADVDAVLTGYLGSAEQGPAVLDAVTRVKAANPKAIWALDPVIGDHGRIFVKPGIPEFIRRTAVDADLLTPNGFELSYLTGHSCERLAEALEAANELRLAGRAKKSRIVVATGLATAECGAAALTTLAVGPTGAWRVTTPRLDHPANGAGDLFAALFLGRHLGGAPLDAAVAAAAGAVHAVIARSAQARSAELLLIAAQDELVRPTYPFLAVPV